MPSQLRPFSVNPEVMERIRPMQVRDIPRVADLHHAAMGNSLWAKLGKRFLRNVYRGLFEHDLFYAFVYVEDGRIGGFIAGSGDPDVMMKDTFRKAWFLLGLSALPAVRKPAVLRHLLTTARYFEASAKDENDGVKAESLFCSFEPNLRGKRISGHINKVLFDELLARGHKYVKVTTEVDNKGANRQLTSWGFEDRGHFQFYGKDMVVYVLDLEESERVAPVSRHPVV